MTEDENQLGTAENTADEITPEMISETHANEADEQQVATESVINTSEKNIEEAVQPEKVRKYHAPLYIAACIFLAAVLFFGIKLCFFNTNINGTWGFDVKTLDGKDTRHYNLTFDDENVRLQSYNTVYIGRLSIKEEDGSYIKSEDGKPMLRLNMVLSGKPFVFKLNYEFEGNVFTGRTLKLTDLSGMFYEPDLKSDNSDDVKKRKKNTGYVETDDKIYYIWSLTPAVENGVAAPPKSFKADDKLTGSWLLKNENTVYPSTLNFNKDGTFSQLSSELEIYGTYTVDKGVCTLKWTEIGNSEKQAVLNYTADNSKLTLTQEYEGITTMKSELKKVKDKYAFKEGNN